MNSARDVRAARAAYIRAWLEREHWLPRDDYAPWFVLTKPYGRDVSELPDDG